jgi:malonyl-CoA O-methyltransferase
MINKTEKEDAFFLGRYSCDEMMQRLEFMSLQPKQIVVLGEVNRYCERTLQKKYPLANIIIADVNDLPEVNNTVDLIFANLFLPWVKLPEALQVWRKKLRSEGLVIFSGFGPDTLKELHQAMPDSFTAYFIDMHDVGDAFTHARFADPVLDVELLTVSYKSKSQLCEELKLNGLIAEECEDVILKSNPQGLFSVSLELVFGHAWGPHLEVDHVANNEGIVKIPLAHLQKKTKL